MSNNVLDEQFKPRRERPVPCREKLGGLIREYYREAAGRTAAFLMKTVSDPH